MEASEKDYLLKDRQLLRKTHKCTRIGSTGRRFIIICLLNFLYFLPIAMLSYLVNEWIQHTLKLEYFLNKDFSANFSSCDNQNHSSEYETYTKVQQDSAHWVMYNSIAQQAIGFLSSLFIASYTDTYGRKFLFILTTLFLVIRTATLSVVIYMNASFLFIVGVYGLEGLSGSNFAFLNASFSSVADIIKDTKTRVLAVVGVEAILLLNVMISGLVSGIFVDKYGFLIPMLACTGLAFASLLMTIFVLPETLKPELRVKPRSIAASLKRPFEFYTSSSFSGKRLEYVLLLLAFCFAELGSQNRSSMETVYLLGMPFCWTPTLIGYYELARHFGQAVVGLGSVKLFQMCMSNEMIAIISTVFCIASYVVESFAATELAIFMVAVIAVFSFSMIPMIRGIMSTITPADKQGSMFASIAAVEVFSCLTASVSENSVYAATVSVFNGFVFLVMGGYIFIDFILLVLYTCISRREKKVFIEEVFSQNNILPDNSNADCNKQNETLPRSLNADCQSPKKDS